MIFNAWSSSWPTAWCITSCDPVREVHSPRRCSRLLAAITCFTSRSRASFHVACGMLHLFGYHADHPPQLPAGDRLHRHCGESTSTEGFLIRVVFNPWPSAQRKPRGSRSRSRRRRSSWRPGPARLPDVWLKGSWGFSVPDALFWGILGARAGQCPVDARETPRKPVQANAARWPGDRARPSHVRDDLVLCRSGAVELLAWFVCSDVPSWLSPSEARMPAFTLFVTPPAAGLGPRPAEPGAGLVKPGSRGHAS